MNDTVIGAETNFGYDPLNRLTSTTYNYTSGAVGYTYAYDRFGNRWSQTVTSGSGPQPSYTFNYNNNQITTAGYTYDAAGNMTYDGSHHYTYDAEGNILQVDNGQTATYVCDAMNRRVRSQTAAATYEYMYDYAGRRTSSWLNPSSGNPGTGNEGRIYWDGRQIAFRAEDGTTYFDHQDWLGTERMRTNDTGAIAATYTSLPFGDASSAKLGGEDANQDNNLFASLDFDTESNTSHAQFRNYSQTQGRWLSPDPYAGSYDLTNPESFNRYAYVLNNPLSLIDPTGLDCSDGVGMDLGEGGGNEDPCEGYSGSQGDYGDSGDSGDTGYDAAQSDSTELQVANAGQPIKLPGPTVWGLLWCDATAQGCGVATSFSGPGWLIPGITTQTQVAPPTSIGSGGGPSAPNNGWSWDETQHWPTPPTTPRQPFTDCFNGAMKDSAPPGKNTVTVVTTLTGLLNVITPNPVTKTVNATNALFNLARITSSALVCSGGDAYFQP